MAGVRAVDSAKVYGIRTLLPVQSWFWLIRHGRSVSGRAATCGGAVITSAPEASIFAA